jgi:cytochrome c5
MKFLNLTATIMLAASSPILEAYNEQDYPVFPGPSLEQGRSVWLEDCMLCHGSGMYGAPSPEDPENWGYVREKSRDTLYQHAIEGFSGPQGNAMPAKGGNRELSDQQVRDAVDYMVELAEHYRKLDEW